MKELTKIYGVLLQDKRVKSEQAKYESFTRQRNSVLAKYKKVSQAFNDLVHGLMNAQSFYSEMKDTVESLERNVETFVSNRRSEGAQLLHRIEQDKASSADHQADRERDRLQHLMERMSVDPRSSSPTKLGGSRPASRPAQSNDPYASKSPPISPPYYSKPPTTYSNGPSSTKYPQTPASFPSFPRQPTTDHVHQAPVARDSYHSTTTLGGGDSYNPMTYPYQSPASPAPIQPIQPSQQLPQHGNHYVPQGYVPPPPPPGPPPSSQGIFGNPVHPYPSGPGGYASQPPRSSSASQSQSDPWAGLNAWK